MASRIRTFKLEKATGVWKEPTGSQLCRYTMPVVNNVTTSNCGVIGESAGGWCGWRFQNGHTGNGTGNEPVVGHGR